MDKSVCFSILNKTLIIFQNAEMGHFWALSFFQICSLGFSKFVPDARYWAKIGKELLFWIFKEN